jgi:hydroxyacylglutathione hydrolase
MQLEDEGEFVAFMTHNQPVRPANMGNIVAINQGKRPQTESDPSPELLAPSEARQRIGAGAIVLDVRPGDAFAAGHVAGSLNVQLTHGSFEQWVGWILPAEGDVILAVGKAEDAVAAARKLAFVGLDSRVTAFVSVPAWKEAGFPLAELPSIEAPALEQRIAREGIPVLDVRDASEWNDGHIASAAHRSFKVLPQMLDGLPVTKDQEVAVICGSGLRSMIACSILGRAGFSRLVNVTGGMAAWRRAGLPTTTS